MKTLLVAIPHWAGWGGCIYSGDVSRHYEGMEKEINKVFKGKVVWATIDEIKKSSFINVLKYPHHEQHAIFFLATANSWTDEWRHVSFDTWSPAKKEAMRYRYAPDGLLYRDNLLYVFKVVLEE